MQNEYPTPTALADEPSFRAFALNRDPAAVRYWSEWLAQRPHRQPDVDAAVRLVQQLASYRPDALPPEQIEQQVNRLHQRLATAPGAAATTLPGSLLTTLRQSWPRWVAAAMLAGVGLAGIYWAMPSARQPDPLAPGAKPLRSERVQPRVSPERSAPALLTYRTRFGERRSVRLPDGSVALLNANSTLRLVDWSADRREVALEGEAFFRVSRRQRPDQSLVKFRVNARQVTVDVVGTQFNVSTRNRRVKVMLNEGRIRLNVVAQRRTLDLQPGDLIEVTEAQQIALRNHVDPAQHTAWTANELVFDETPLADVAQLIQNNYGYTVEFAQPALAQRRLTATLPDNNLDMLLTALEKVFSLTITRHQKTIRLASATTSPTTTPLK